jgi:hypothetical protein
MQATARKAPSRRQAREPSRAAALAAETPAASVERPASAPPASKGARPVASASLGEGASPTKHAPGEKPKVKIWDPDSVLLPK